MSSDEYGEYNGCPFEKTKEYVKLQEQGFIKSEAITGQSIHYDVLKTDVLNFDFRQATISPASYPALDSAADILNKNGLDLIFISGFTDDIGDYATNKDKVKAVFVEDICCAIQCRV